MTKRKPFKDYTGSPRANPARYAAKARGDKRFWSDVPCKRGHIGERLVSTYGCCQCSRDSGNRIELARRERVAGRSRPAICEVCGKPPTSKGIAWDHDHITGDFRGWLCSPCNVAIGMTKDDPALLRKLADYLDVHSERRDAA